MSSPDHVDGALSAASPGAQKPDRTDHLAPETVRSAAEGRRVADWLDSSGLRTVHLGLIDASGTLREKRLGRSAAAPAFEDGWSFIDAIQWWGPDDTLWQRVDATSGPAAVETDSGRPFPFAGDATFFLAEFGAPLRELSPRFQLQRMIELAASSGIRAQVAWEFECIVLDSALASSGVPQPVMAANRCWSALTMAAEDEELGNLVDTLEAGAIPVDHVCAELGPGCLEIATFPEPALRAADSAALAKLYTKAHFTRAGRRATFMAQLGPGFPGRGGHPSLSLHRLADDLPLICDEPGILSRVGRWANAWKSDGCIARVVFGYLYSRYKRFGDDVMDETFCPIIWREDASVRRFSSPTCGGRSAGPVPDPSRRGRRDRPSDGRADRAPQLTRACSSGDAARGRSRRTSIRLGTLSAAGAVSVGSPVTAVTRSRSPEPPNRAKRRRRFEPKTITSAPQS